jgi:uncharacterized membrane protein
LRPSPAHLITGSSAWSSASLYFLGAALIMATLAALAGLTDWLSPHPASLPHLAAISSLCCSAMAADRVSYAPQVLGMTGNGNLSRVHPAEAM